MRVKKALEKYLGSIYPAAEVEIFDFCFCGRANIAVMVGVVPTKWSIVVSNDAPVSVGVLIRSAVSGAFNI